jgi:hypothetical protein
MPHDETSLAEIVQPPGGVLGVVAVTGLVTGLTGADATLTWFVDDLTAP